MTFERAAPLPAWLEADLPFDRLTFRVPVGPDAGRRMHLVAHGTSAGTPVVLFHGNPTWCYLWRKVVARLDPSRFRIIAPDLLGFGLSDKPWRIAAHSVARHADNLASLTEAMGVRNAIFVGQDWGGPLAVAVGARLHNRVAGLVLANTSVLVPERPRGTAFHRFARVPLLSDIAYRKFKRE